LITTIPAASGFIANDVLSMTGSDGGLAFLMKDGSVRSVTTSASTSGHPSTVDFSRVVDGSNASLTGITDLQFSDTAAFAYSASTGKFYTWGAGTYLGSGTASTARTTATEMTNPLPIGVSVVQIGLSGSTYFVLGSDGKVYVVGQNSVGEAGQNSTTAVTTWTTIRDTTGAAGTSLTNVQFISADNTARDNHAISLILKNGSILALGSNSGNKLGISSSTGNFIIPTVPIGSVAGKVAYTVETGGDFGVSLLYGPTDAISVTGSNANGAFGDGTTTSRTPYFGTNFVGNLFDTTLVPTAVANPNASDLRDDTGISVNDIVVNETASTYAVFVVEIGLQSG
jgi:alpha-tubulin suppressor-like RCC1 family protein